jgi:hypothetical protein
MAYILLALDLAVRLIICGSVKIRWLVLLGGVPFAKAGLLTVNPVNPVNPINRINPIDR